MIDNPSFMRIRWDCYMPRTFGGSEYIVIDNEMIVSTFLYLELRFFNTWPDWCQRIFWRVT